MAAQRFRRSDLMPLVLAVMVMCHPSGAPPAEAQLAPAAPLPAVGAGMRIPPPGAATWAARGLWAPVSVAPYPYPTMVSAPWSPYGTYDVVRVGLNTYGAFRPYSPYDVTWYPGGSYYTVNPYAAAAYREQAARAAWERTAAAAYLQGYLKAQQEAAAYLQGYAAAREER